MRHGGGQPGGPRSGFSLLELLVVLAVMGILGGLGWSGMSGVRNWLAGQETRGLFRELESACRIYRAENGCWPGFLSAGAVDLNADPESWQAELGRLMERPVQGRVLADGWGNRKIWLVADLDNDRRIGIGELPGLSAEEVGDWIEARVAVYSLDGEGRLVSCNWDER